MQKHRAAALHAADSAESVLAYFEERHPQDARPRRAIEAAQAWARGDLAMADARVATFAAHAAARDASHRSACFAARAAGHAAATAHVAAHAPYAYTYATKAKTAGLEEVIQPIVSLISKSEKARRKLAPESWQHRMLQDNLRALCIAFALLSGSKNGAEVATREDFQAALRAFADMTTKSEKAQAKFTPDTSQHTLQRNRLRAFRAAEALIRAKLR